MDVRRSFSWWQLCFGQGPGRLLALDKRLDGLRVDGQPWAQKLLLSASSCLNRSGQTSSPWFCCHNPRRRAQGMSRVCVWPTVTHTSTHTPTASTGSLSPAPSYRRRSRRVDTTWASTRVARPSAAPSTCRRPMADRRSGTARCTPFSTCSALRDPGSAAFAGFQNYVQHAVHKRYVISLSTCPLYQPKATGNSSFSWLRHPAARCGR